jgi:hypothetical protein
MLKYRFVAVVSPVSYELAATIDRLVDEDDLGVTREVYYLGPRILRTHKQVAFGSGREHDSEQQ